ncbi:hypothetical protein BOTBODRAFT_48409 [Botryobasidium botryosum FD-172 SS1]|uniref:Uncharacterized protein n=1 Tax=Botryobasidium botryosum (strain FD-172 SS1) TaxID=930990 RepID=A0A067M8D4_BOTB1|nr:hypothetical protein BOTBODRAFT_48409 [Botryobasidium botryosum FD-172 SS1]
MARRGVSPKLRTPFPRRKAFIFGINHTEQKWKAGSIPDGKYGRDRVRPMVDNTLDMDLETHEDARKIKDLLEATRKEDIRMLLDEGTDPAIQPNKQNIVLEDTHWGDKLFFHGKNIVYPAIQALNRHGEQVFDIDGDSDGGMDDCDH